MSGLTKNVRDFDKEIQTATATQRANTGAVKQGIEKRAASLATGALGASIRNLTEAGVQSVSNPYMGFGSALTGQIVDRFGFLGGNQVGITGAGRAGGRTAGILSLMAEGGAEPTREQAEDLHNFYEPIETRKARAEALAQAVATEGKVEASVAFADDPEIKHVFSQLATEISSLVEEMRQGWPGSGR